MIKLKAIFNRLLAEYSTNNSDGPAETGHLPAGYVRKLNHKNGKPEQWFKGGGYTQVEFPEADDMFAGEEPEFIERKMMNPNLTSKKIIKKLAKDTKKVEKNISKEKIKR